MDLTLPTPSQLRLGLRALKSVALAKGRELNADERTLVAGIQRFFGSAIDIDRLDCIGPAELAAALGDRQIRRQLVGAMIAMSLIDGDADPAESELISAYADALEVDEKAVRNVEQLARHERFGLRIDVLRRFWAIDALRARVHEHGLGEVLRFVKANVGRLEDAFLAARFHGLRQLPDQTLGREYIRFLDDNGWPVPGERGALSDIIVYHDMTHVLAGYGTDPIGEIETACFSAGCRQEQPFTFVLFVLLQFHVGVRMPPGTPTQTGHFDIERALAALQRGAAMTVDLTEDWDYWQDVDQPLGALRARYNISAAPLSEPRGRHTSTTGCGTRP